MKKISICLVIVMILSFCTSCGKEETLTKSLQLKDMKAICELSTMNCYYHNLVKYKVEDAEKFWWWTKDKNLWIEYNGIVTMGIDISLLSLEVQDEKVIIKLPSAKVLETKVDETTFSKDCFIVAKDSADITAEDEKKALTVSQEDLLKKAEANSELLKMAQERAKELLENYVNNIGEAIGVEYEIEWIYIDEDGKVIN